MLKEKIKTRKSPHQNVMVADRFTCHYHLEEGRIKDYSLEDNAVDSFYGIEVECFYNNEEFLDCVQLILFPTKDGVDDNKAREEYLTLRSAMVIISLSLEEYGIKVDKFYNG